MSSINFADDWIGTADIWYWKQLLFQPSHNQCPVEKNVPIVLILPSRWQDGAESQWMETASCLCLHKWQNKTWQKGRYQVAVNPPGMWLTFRVTWVVGDSSCTETGCRCCCCWRYRSRSKKMPRLKRLSKLVTLSSYKSTFNIVVVKHLVKSAAFWYILLSKYSHTLQTKLAEQKIFQCYKVIV